MIHPLTTKGETLPPSGTPETAETSDAGHSKPTRRQRFLGLVYSTTNVHTYITDRVVFFFFVGVCILPLSFLYVLIAAAAAAASSSLLLVPNFELFVHNVDIVASVHSNDRVRQASQVRLHAEFDGRIGSDASVCYFRYSTASNLAASIFPSIVLAPTNYCK
jgi:hypothetical protein